MKRTFIFVLIMNILFAVTCIWVIVEFILYLVKDNPFNWLSLWLAVTTLVAAVIGFIRMWLSSD